MRSASTPGPWTLVQTAYRVGSGFSIQNIRNGKTEKTICEFPRDKKGMPIVDPETYANAQIICAAPGMALELQAYAKTVERMNRDNRGLREALRRLADYTENITANHTSSPDYAWAACPVCSGEHKHEADCDIMIEVNEARAALALATEGDK